MLDYNILNNDLFVIAGPCSAESPDLCVEVAKFCASVCEENDITYVFKASFDKANRTSMDSYRGPGIDKGIEIFKKVKKVTPFICTDVHLPSHCEKISEIADIIQIPAFLARQTDLVTEAARTNRIINIKKPQFISHDKMQFIIDKCKYFENNKLLLTERGSMFGSNDLVVDFRNIIEMKKLGYPVVIDSTHSCQKMNAGGVTSGNREYAPYFAKAGVMFGSSGVFAEVHPNPEQGLSDASNMIDYKTFENLIKDLRRMKDANLC